MLIASVIAAAIGTVLVWIRHDHWYGSIELPGWAAGPAALRLAWAAGVASTGLAAWLLRDDSVPLLGLAAALLIAQALTAIAWTEIFYQRRNPRTAFTIISLHWAAAALATAAAFAVDRTAGTILIPWLVLVAYVGAINFFVWQLESH